MHFESQPTHLRKKYFFQVPLQGFHELFFQVLFSYVEEKVDKKASGRRGYQWYLLLFLLAVTTLYSIFISITYNKPGKNKRIKET